jgi:hypothetical protein
MESSEPNQAGQFKPHQCEYCEALLITGKDLIVPVEQVFNGADRNCAFFKWCLNWDIFPSDKDPGETTEGDATSFRIFSSLRISFAGQNHREHISLYWVKPSSTTEESTKVEWPRYAGKKKLLLYADTGQCITS